jgi:hypothetical protein
LQHVRQFFFLEEMPVEHHQFLKLLHFYGASVFWLPINLQPQFSQRVSLA